MKALLALSFIAVLASVALVSAPAPAAHPCVEKCIAKRAAGTKGNCGTMCVFKCNDSCEIYGNNPGGKKAKMKRAKMKKKK